MLSNNSEYVSLLKKWEAIQIQAPKVIEAFLEPVEPILQSLNIQYRVETRLKELSSIWWKMKRKDIVFEKIGDIVGIRLVVTSTEEIQACYQVHSAFTTYYRSNLQRCKDYIKAPKPNGYASLHSTFIQNSVPVELQVRNEQMSQVATIGTASHEVYKTKRMG